MRTLITGASGLIGSHLAEKAFQMGDEVGLIKKKNNIIDSLKGEFSFFYGDIINPYLASNNRKFKPIGFSILLHKVFQLCLGLRLLILSGLILKGLIIF